VFFGITLLAIAALYLYVAPGLRSRLLNERMSQLLTAAHSDSTQIVKSVGTADPTSLARNKVDAAALASGDRVTLLLVSESPSGLQLSTQADSSKAAAAAALPQGVALRTTFTLEIPA